MTKAEDVTISADQARAFITALFQAAGVEAEASALVAEGLVEADLQGVGSHGALQAPNYLRRVRAGTISRENSVRLVHRSGAVSVFDAGLVLGHAAVRQVTGATMASAKQHGIACAAVRSATHFGVAGRHASQAAEAGMIGIVMCNTRPMLPAPGGSESVVGNNPLAIAVPVSGRTPIVFDMAMSAGAMGKIRLAARTGQPIPDDWALDSDGRPTTDAVAALAGLLRPAGGAKGFGLALMIDFLCALSGGAAGPEVGMLYGDASAPADCSWLIVVLDPGHFGLAEPFAERVAGLASHVLASSSRPGGGPVSLPGDHKLHATRKAEGMLKLPRTLVEDLERLSIELGGPEWPIA